MNSPGERENFTNLLKQRAFLTVKKYKHSLELVYDVGVQDIQCHNLYSKLGGLSSESICVFTRCLILTLSYQLIHVRPILVKMVEPVTVTLETSHVVVLQGTLGVTVARTAQVRS